MSQPTTASTTSSTAYNKVALAACFGTFIEWYDFLTFASLASYFGVLFFPPGSEVATLLSSLATFGIGMVVRPLGAALFGSLGDRHGRRSVFITTIVLMGAATFAIGLLPNYAQAGVIAPILLVSLRILQGLAMGGEIGGANVYLTEHAPAAQRGVKTSVLQLMGSLGILASSSQVVLLQHWLSAEEFHSWGWRIPFLVSALLLALTIKARLALHESPAFEKLRAEENISTAPLRDCLRDPLTRGRMALLFFCVSSGGGLLFFSSQVYAPLFLKSIVKMDPVIAGQLGLFATLSLIPLIIACGWLSDRIGRRPTVLAGLLLGAAGIQPIFHGLQYFANPTHANIPVIALLLLILALAVALVTGPQTAILGELFPTRTRYTAVGLPHNLAAGWIGGLSPLVITYIGKETGQVLDGLWYPVLWLTIATVTGLIFLPETRGKTLDS